MTRHRSISILLKLLLMAGLGLTYSAALHAETVDVQAVLATEAGKSGAVPSSLAKFKALLANCSFQKFADAGKQTLTFSGTSPKASATVGAFTLDLSREGTAKFDLVVKEGAKTVLGPLAYTFAKEKTKQIELPTAKGTYIVFLTLEKE